MFFRIWSIAVNTDDVIAMMCYKRFIGAVPSIITDSDVLRLLSTELLLYSFRVRDDSHTDVLLDLLEYIRIYSMSWTITGSTKEVLVKVIVRSTTTVDQIVRLREMGLVSGDDRIGDLLI